MGCLTGSVLVITLCLLNAFTAHYLLSVCYFLFLLFIQLIYLCHYFQQYLPARCIAVFNIPFFCGFIALAYHNDTELLLLLNVAAIVLLFESWWLIAVLIVLDMFAFIFIRLYNTRHVPLVESLPASRGIISVISLFMLMTVVLLYYKYEQQRYRLQLEALNRRYEEKTLRLENLNRSKEKVLAILSQELRQPFTSIKSLLDINEELSAGMFHDLVFRLRNSLNNGLLSLENTLRWSSAQLKGTTAWPQYCSVYDALLGLKQQFGAPLQEKQLSFSLPANRDTLVYADPDHLNIVLSNILSNAVKFTPKGGSVVAAVKAVNGIVEISIADTGIGMDAQIQQQLFDPEQHFTRLGTDHEYGTGLGLLVVKELVTLNGGMVHLSSVVKKGTVLTIRLPGSYV